MKKIFSCIAVICLLMNVCLISVHAEASNIVENSDYVKFNLETGVSSYHSFEDLPDAIGDADYACSPGYFPNGIEEINTTLANPAAVVGPGPNNDNRFRVTDTTIGPYCNTVYIHVEMSDGDDWNTSAFMIGPRAVATAAHCVYDFEEDVYATSIQVIPAKNGSSNPFGQETVTVNAENLLISQAYLQTGARADDWAIIELNTPLGNLTGWLGIRWQSESYDGRFVYNTGYPAAYGIEGQLGDSSYMFCSSGNVRNSETKCFKGDWDATGGNSGGPVYTYYNETGYTLIGILTGGSGPDGFPYGPDDDGEHSFSYATRITEDLYNLFISYRTST